MRITDLLTKETIAMDLAAGSKETVIDELVNQLDAAGKLTDKEAFKENILAREQQSTTGIGEGIAIPHAKSAAVKHPAIAFGRALNGIDFESMDGQPANLFFMIAASEGANDAHLEALSRLATFLMDEQFREKVLAADSKEAVLLAVSDKETEVEGPEEETVATDDVPDTAGKRILAVTACPTGIAHTYMAAEKLNDRA
ncbi:fructose PTS transporter subunit IIA, partial [Planomicrobium okeanokoites]|uniref:fructose PTS transporter subunit IIA n=1 Tax=Planomicrobium okeanokoites TaxID=244 RepID=UPI0035640E78